MLVLKKLYICPYVASQVIFIIISSNGEYAFTIQVNTDNFASCYNLNRISHRVINIYLFALLIYEVLLFALLFRLARHFSLSIKEL